MSSEEKNQSLSSGIPTLGFPHLERLVEQENFNDLNKVFMDGYDRLEGLSKKKGSDVSRKNAAKKAMRAMELTMNLLRDFIQIKEDLIQKSQRNHSPGSK